MQGEHRNEQARRVARSDRCVITTAAKTAEKLREQAARGPRLAAAVTDGVVTRRLAELAIEFEKQADELDAALTRSLPPR